MELMKTSPSLRQAVTACLFLAAAVLTFPGGGAFAAGAKEGDALPPFNAQGVDGEAIDSRDLAGKAVIIDFWSIFCVDCIKEFPHLVEIYEKYRDKGLVLLGVNPDAAVKRVKSFIAQNDVFAKVPQIHDKRRQVFSALKVSILPTTVLVDPGGTIRMYHIGYKPGFELELEEAVKKILPSP